jgi:hypothetical protein
MPAPRRIRLLVVVAQAALLVAAPVAFAATADDAEQVHLTAPGDTLIGLGRRYLVDPAQWPQLARLNQVRDPRRLPIGRGLRIPLRLMRVEPAPATVLAASGAVRSGGAAVTAGQSLPEGSGLDTGADGHVTVRLVDGTLLRLRAGGRLRIDESRRVPAADAVRSGVQLDQGRVEVQAKPARGGQPGFRIHTPQGVLAVRGTEFRVAADAAQTLGEVLEGAVAVAGRGGAEQIVGAGHGTVVDAAGRVAAPVALLPAPDVSGLPALHERPLVRLALPPMPGAAGYRVQVARDERFDELLADLRSTSPELRIPGLADGRYPMRLRAVNDKGLEGRDAMATLALKARPEPPLPRAPAPAAVLRGSAVELAWAASSEAASYRLQLARDDGSAAPFAAPLLDLKDLGAPTHRVDGLPPGAYVWRLGSVRADGDAGPFGDPQRFELRALPPQPAPPAPPAVGDRSVRFFWQGQPGQRFEVQVARDEAFRSRVAEPTLDGTEFELPLPGPGRYFVRLRALDADGFVGPWSAAQFFDVPNCVRDAQAGCVRTEGGPLQLQ